MSEGGPGPFSVGSLPVPRSARRNSAPENRPRPIAREGGEVARKPAAEWSIDYQLRFDESLGLSPKYANLNFDYLVSKVKDALPSFSRRGELDASYVDNSIRFLVHHFDVLVDEQVRMQQLPPCSGADDRIPLMLNTFARSLVGDRRVRMELLEIMDKEMKVSQCWSDMDKDKFQVAAALFREAEKWLIARQLLFSGFVALEEKQHAIKIVVLGASKAGKSCLITRYLQDTFMNDSRATVGVDFAYKVYNLPDYPGVSCRAQIWDTAGQERYNAITGNYLRGAHGVMLVYNLQTDEPQHCMDTYAQVIEDHAGPHTTTVLFGNFSDVVYNTYDWEGKMSADEMKTLIVRADASLHGCEDNPSKLLLAAQHAVRCGRQGNHFWGSAKTGDGVREAMEFLINQSTLTMIAVDRQARTRSSTFGLHSGGIGDSVTGSKTVDLGSSSSSSSSSSSASGENKSKCCK